MKDEDPLPDGDNRLALLMFFIISFTLGYVSGAATSGWIPFK